MMSLMYSFGSGGLDDIVCCLPMGNLLLMVCVGSIYFVILVDSLRLMILLDDKVVV
jgi:hypothetical protein